MDIECRPVLGYIVAHTPDKSCSENDVQEALIEGGLFVKQIMSGLEGKEIEPVSVYQIIQRTEIKSRLENIGLKELVAHLNKAERNITQNNFEASLLSSRTAFEKVIDWEMEKRGLEQTNNYHNNLERLMSHGYLDKDTTALLQTYYHCYSTIGVHDKGEIKAGIYEAQMGYRMTLVMIDYLISKLP